MISRSARASIDFGFGSTAATPTALPTARRNAGRSGNKWVMTNAIVSPEAENRLVTFLKKASTRETSKSSITTTTARGGSMLVSVSTSRGRSHAGIGGLLA